MKHKNIDILENIFLNDFIPKVRGLGWFIIKELNHIVLRLEKAIKYD